jgi:peptidoglycan/LPS O-acetylase OafA/YrhL
MEQSEPTRMRFIDAIKAVASQLIVLHHLAFYGPMSDRAAALAPDLMAWFSDHARLAVQAFLVVAGFLAARGLAPHGVLVARSPLGAIAERYARLAIPYLAALVLAVAAAALARAWMDHPSISAAPTLDQAIAHAFLLQDVLGYESLSAGLWYVAIDLQLFALFVAVLWLARAARQGADGGLWIAPVIVSAVAAASLLEFNRDPAWDRWALYFFGAYAMGAAAFWIAGARRAVAWLAVLLGIVAIALAIDFRIRIALALALAIALAVAARTGVMTRWPQSRTIAYLGRISYSVFLVHFPVCLVINAAWVRFLPETPWLHAAGMLTAWAASVAAGALFYRVVESRAGWIVARIRESTRSRDRGAGALEGGGQP